MLSKHWATRPALVMLWRHLGCGCGLERIERLKTEYEAYRSSGLDCVVVAPGEIERVVAYKDRHELPTPILADPEYMTHKAFGLSYWSKEQVLYDAPDEFCTLTRGHRRGVSGESSQRGTSPSRRSMDTVRRIRCEDRLNCQCRLPLQLLRRLSRSADLHHSGATRDGLDLEDASRDASCKVGLGRRS